jgi:MbtH protein
MFDNEQHFNVVLNEEEQYSIWPSSRTPPPGWRVSGFSGTRAECLDHIERVWTDMRPLSLREQMADTVDASVTTDISNWSSPSYAHPADHA